MDHLYLLSDISIHALLAESDTTNTRTRHSMIYFYPRSPCGERRQSVPRSHPATPISIHALLAESDRVLPQTLAFLQQFLSTLSLRRATGSGTQHLRRNIYFYPRSPCGERLRTFWLGCRCRPISIHALLAESDAVGRPGEHPPGRFLSTLSLRRATWESGRRRGSQKISIHALLAESDRKPHQYFRYLLYFYPRSPCGERLFPP